MVIVVHLRTLSVLAGLLGIVSLLPAGALAQSSSDPSAGSPPGVVYQLPLAKGRTDAAPRRKDSGAKDSGASNADSTQSNGGSLYRSENNFGSSSHVPGSADPKNSNKDDGNRSRTDLSGRGDSSLPTAAVDSGNTSLPGSLGLLALIVAAGVGIGYIALRSRRLGR